VLYAAANEQGRLMRRLLVTGGAGFIGANFVHHWLQVHRGDRVVVLDALTYAGNTASLEDICDAPQLRFVHGDICDTPLVEQLLREEALDVIVHFAAESHVDRSITGPDVFVKANVEGTHSLLKAARRVWIEERAVPTHRFHHVSTDEVYGSLGPEDSPFHEGSPYAPNSPYSATKAASDHLVRAYHHTYGLATTISNCSNNYGPFQFPEKLIPLTIVNILEGKSLPVYGDGQNVRDWLHVADHCRGIDAILARGLTGQTYNIGGRSECMNIDLVRQLCAIADDAFRQAPELAQRFRQSMAARGSGCGSSIAFVKDRPGHDRRYAIDCAKMERQLSFTRAKVLDEGLRETFHWYVQHEPWWRCILDGSYRNRSLDDRT
jgi:dTDP-glucose 4,6-dehydratase